MRAVSARPLLPRPSRARLTGAVAAVTVTATLGVLAACGGSGKSSDPAKDAVATVRSSPAPSRVPSNTPAPAANIYSAAGANMLSPAVKGQRNLVYVPNHSGGTVSVIDPATYKVIDTYATAPGSQHVVPSYDLQTLWVNNDEGGNSLTPIDPRTGQRRGPNVPVQDPYNMYFTPDGKSAIVVAEAEQRLDFRDPQTMAMQSSTHVDCKGINHADFSPDLSYAVFTCEFSGKVVKIDMKTRQVLGYLQLNPDGMPQDIRLDPQGRYFWVADMMANGVYIVDGNTMTKVGFLPTGPEAHGIYPSRDGRFLYVSDRGGSAKHGEVSVVDPVARKVVAQWVIPGGGTPDMGGVSADGKELWLSGRRDNVVYVFDTTTGKVTHVIPVGLEPHGLAVWPQPGRFSLGHTGNMR
jgi:YVTN family beta-propeller protein